MSEPAELRRVRRAVRARRAAELEYRASLQAARDAGFSLSQVAAPAELTRAGVRKLTEPPSTVD